MSQPYIGEIRMFGGSFAPAGWMFCDGQLVPIAENDALFTLIGTTYGGDGQETFGLPDLRGRVPIHMNNQFILGENGGVESVTLTTNQIPGHNHPALANTNPATANIPTNTRVLANEGPAGISQVFSYLPPGGAQQPMLNTAIAPEGGSQPHDNIHPSLGINYIISLFGVFPTQS